MFTKAQFLDNEDNNYHTENGIALANEFGTEEEKELMAQIQKDHYDRGHINPDEIEARNAIVKKYYPMLEDNSVIEGTEMGSIGDVDVKQFASKDGTAIQLTGSNGYVQLSREEAAQLAARLAKWAGSKDMAYPGEYDESDTNEHDATGLRKILSKTPYIGHKIHGHDHMPAPAKKKPTKQNRPTGPQKESTINELDLLAPNTDYVRAPNGEYFKVNYRNTGTVTGGGHKRGDKAAFTNVEKATPREVELLDLDSRLDYDYRDDSGYKSKKSNTIHTGHDHQGGTPFSDKDISVYAMDTEEYETGIPTGVKTALLKHMTQEQDKVTNENRKRAIAEWRKKYKK
jgi:hypothetical protein